MGQQQMFIILVVAIIVAVATYSAIKIMSVNIINSNRDAVRQDLFSIAAEAQNWYLKPVNLKGGGYSFKGVTFVKIGFGYKTLVSDTDVVNSNGEYKMQVNDSVITVTAIPVHDKEDKLIAKIKKGEITFENQ